MQRQILAGPGCRRWLAGVFLLAVLAACGQTTTEDAVSEPAGAVVHLARQLARGDLDAYARDAVPPVQYEALSQAWGEGDSLWPLTSLPLDEHLPRMLASLADAEAEVRLGKAFDSQIAGQSGSVRQAAHSLGLFGEQYVSHQGQFSDDQRHHYRQLVKAISSWAATAPLSEKAPARAAIGTLATAVRGSGLDGADALRQIGMSGALNALAPVQQTTMTVLAGYGLDVRAALEGLEAGLLSASGDQARVHVVYPLAGQRISFDADMVRIDGRWYMAQNLADVEQILMQAQKARQERQQENAGAMELAEGEAAGRPLTNEQMATGP